MAPHKVFVCAATGTQGGAVARQLRAIGWDVNTTTRDPNSPAAQALTSIGINVHQGAWTETAALESAIAGCDLLFLNMMPDLANPPSEAEFGTNVLRIAKAAGVTHVVYSSGIALPGAESNPFVQMAFAAKGVLEKAVQESGFQHWTILRPGFFMANYLVPKVNMLYPGAAETGLFELAFNADTELPMIDHEDIGASAVAAFQNPDKFHQQAIDLISEVVTVEKAMETMRRGMGRNIRAKYLTDEELEEAKARNPMLAIQEVLRLISSAGNVPTAKEWGVAVGTFEQFVEREKKDFEETYQNVSN
ncbi:hypothetical protein NEMBOFW57_001177 [Staphylotrichum longicolle]|uniref:NmrA-like domain-containing protein n=1 Tax=Staphylotrichum longicolle TaxID=669026 RepID=A0AAD4I2C5_9PEZI|nr:hypothetical protein NEMBOFW57_001177 [Staphylotrichum longicolle]